jgi:hypothetical protein
MNVEGIRRSKQRSDSTLLSALQASTVMSLEAFSLILRTKVAV